jgi:DnaJ-domain-containing protein 1
MRFKRLFKRPDPADPFAVFAETYGIRIPRDAPPKAEPDEPEPIELRLMRAHLILGVPVGASRQEIGQAYKKLALMYHPDKMAGRGPKAREHSEERMKEINAAYAELRRREASLQRA